NVIAMVKGFVVMQEVTELNGNFKPQNSFNLLGRVVQQGFFQAEDLVEQPLRQSMSANHVESTPLALWSERDLMFAEFDPPARREQVKRGAALGRFGEGIGAD